MKHSIPITLFLFCCFNLDAYYCMKSENRRTHRTRKYEKYTAPLNRNQIKFKKKEPKEVVKSGIEESFETVKGKDTELPYKVLDPCSSRLTSLMTAAKSRKQRYKKNTIMLEGRRLISDALQAGVKPLMILFTRKQLIEDLPILDEYVTPEKTVLHKIPYEYLQNWSNLTTSPGLTGLFEMPKLENRPLDFPTLPITFICDNVREPGNLGSILRIAAAIPVQKVVLLKGCVDLWDPKVTRTSCGSLFNLRIENNAMWEDVRDNCQGKVIVADHLASDEYDPVTMRAEDYVDSVDMESEVPEEIQEDEEEEEILDKNKLRKVLNIPVHPYYGIEYKNHESYVIVIGGETEGLSEETFLFAKENNGVRVNIPLSNCVNSLNAATALGIITFEIKKQLQN
ncbi:rRNA methyltransferase 3A, mitochondrial [Planococcus citri]|uniref:rRNA methyltransferase 3A, mitochondrial n=1 Tax=Planococcus citri TaxID=170843 RepID=UPI0031F772FE